MMFLQAASTLEQTKSFLPKISFDNFGTIIAIFFLIIFVLAGFGIGLYYFIRRLKFNREIIILEDVAGSDDIEPVGKDKAMLVKIGRGGTELLYLRKGKVYKGAYGKRMGARRYYFAIDSAGYWQNVTLGSLEKGMNKIGIKPTSVNMRYQNESLMELIKNRYDKPSWLSQYGQIIVNVVFFILVALMFWLYFDAFKSTAPAMVDAANALKEAAEAFRQGVGGLDSLRASGGISPI